MVGPMHGVSVGFIDIAQDMSYDGGSYMSGMQMLRGVWARVVHDDILPCIVAVLAIFISDGDYVV